jgi:hypothetical protein
LAESTVNAIISKRFAKRQNRTRALDGTLRALFQRWHPRLANDSAADRAYAAAAPDTSLCPPVQRALGLTLRRHLALLHGAGGETLGQRGKSKDHRADVKRVVAVVVLDEAGRRSGPATPST